MRRVALAIVRQLVLLIGLVAIVILPAILCALLHVQKLTLGGATVALGIVAVGVGVAAGAWLARLERRVWPVRSSVGIVGQ